MGAHGGKCSEDTRVDIRSFPRSYQQMMWSSHGGHWMSVVDKWFELLTDHASEFEISVNCQSRAATSSIGNTFCNA